MAASPAFRPNGFTLLELAIVLMIIGLIAGGVVAGKEMIRSGEMRSIATDVNRLKSAFNTFQIKYSEFPGDMKDATNYWGTAAGTGSNAACFATDQSTMTATCNGNGNGHVSDNNADASFANPEEWFLAWKHLADAGMISGTFSGTTGSGGVNDAYPAQNVPVSRISGAGYTLYYWSLLANNATIFPGNLSQHVITFGMPVHPSQTLGAALTVTEAELIDVKGDDGLPGTGKIQSPVSTYQACATTAVPSTAVYDIAQTGLKCGLVFFTGF